MRAVNPKKLYLTHFDVHHHPDEIFDQLEQTLDECAHYIRPFYTDHIPAEDIVPLFVAYTQKNYRDLGLTQEQIQTYEYANPSWMSVNGLLRYWKLKDQGRI